MSSVKPVGVLRFLNEQSEGVLSKISFSVCHHWRLWPSYRGPITDVRADKRSGGVCFIRTVCDTHKPTKKHYFRKWLRCHGSAAKIRLHSPSWRNSEVSCCYGDLLLKMFFSLYMLTSAFGLSSNRDLQLTSHTHTHTHKEKWGKTCQWVSRFISLTVHNLFYL